VGNRMNPGEEDDRPCGGDMEGDVFIELDDAVQRRLASQRDECAANGEEDERDINVKDKGCRTGNHEGRAEGISRNL